MTDPESLARARAEFDALVAKEKDMEAAFKKNLTLEACSELTYMGYVIQEALRLNPAAIHTSPTQFEKDTRLGSLTVKANEILLVNIYGLHRNGKWWQRPQEFLPDRFDPSHPLAKTPSGDKRHPFAWLPFSGGKRICFGKTFAEFVLKVKLTMMT